MGRARMAAFVGITTFCVVFLGGCSSESNVVTQTLDSTPSSPVESTAVLTTSPSEKPATSSGSPLAPSTTGAAANPWPQDFNPQQVATAQAALTAVDGYIEVLAAASADPAAKDWSSDIRKYAADPAASQTLDALRSLVTAQVHQTVPPVYDHPTVIKVDEHTAVVETCLDNTHTTAVDADGASVLDPPLNPRSVLTLTLFKYAPQDGGWLVSEKNTSTPVRTC